MSKSKNDFYYIRELDALIDLGVKPEKAKEITDRHLADGNYDKVLQQVEKERVEEEQLQAYARRISARIKAGEKPEDVVNDLKTPEREM